MGTIIRGYDRIEVVGWKGYQSKVYHRYQSEGEFMEHTWPQWLRFRGFRESIYGLNCPTIFFEEEGPDWRAYDQIIPVRLIVTVSFGAPRYRDI